MILSFKQFINENSDTETQLKKLGLRRGGSGYKIGKVIGGNVYVHKQYENQFPKDELISAKSKLPEDFVYHVVKYNPKTKSFTFFRVDDFNTNPEPIIDEYVTVKPDSNEVKIVSDGKHIYHHVWQWVTDDYKYFDVEKSKQRSLKWYSNKDIDKSRIGLTHQWKEVVVKHIKD